MPASTLLKDKWIAITRPSHQAKVLTNKLEESGAHVIQFPLIEIGPPRNLEDIKAQLDNLNDYDLAIFVSANAVVHCLNLVEPNSFKAIKIASTGKKTAEVLEQHELYVDFYPERFFNSEALLALPQLQKFSEGKKIAIIRGDDGRNLLRDKLIQLGAHVDYINVYSRTCPQVSLSLLKQSWDRHQLDIVILTSGTSVISFFQLAADEPWINKLTLLLGSQRLQQKIPEQFQGKILIAEDPSDETIYQVLKTKYG